MKLNVHQIYFKKSQLKGLDPDFLPYDNRTCPVPDEREYYVFRTEHRQGRIAADAYTGYVSWKFGEKTGLSGAKFLSFCRENPGFDVYFINPFPIQISLGNVWQQGDERHPGMKETTQFIFDQLKLGIDLDQIPRSLRLSAFCNFWVGNQKFWDAYIAFCEPIYRYIKEDLPEPHRSRFFKRADVSRSASHFAFVFERLFTTFLASYPEIKAKAYEYDLSELNQRYHADGAIILNELQKLERERPDDPQPLCSNPVMLSAFNLYYLVSERSLTPMGRRIYRLIQMIARNVPFREKIRNHSIYRKLSRRILTWARPEGMNLTAR